MAAALSLFAALAALCTQHAAAQPGILGDTTTYTETFQHPRLEYTLSTFMREPGNLLDLTRPAYSMEVVNETCRKDGTEALREWLYTQTVAVGNRAGGSAITMIYAGMADGTFVGYYEPDRYTFRAAGESGAGPSEQIWTPHADAADVPNAKSKTPKCDLDADTDGTGVCPLGCTSGSSACSGDNGTAYTLSETCPGSTADDCTPPTTSASGCCDKNIRTYYDTAVEHRGVPQALTKWSTYDPRARPWYTEEVNRTAEAGWSSVYVFSTSGELGITRTSKIKRDTSNDTLGVAAMDFELSGISKILNDTMGGTGGWAYIVERSGDDAGKLLGTTFGAPLRDTDTRCSAASRTGECDQGWPATAAASADFLSEAGRGREAWAESPRGSTVTNARGQRDDTLAKYEAVATQFALGGLDWLIVVGQDIHCEPNERFVFGKCEDCPEGQVPRDDRNCEICSQVVPGTVSDEGIDGGIGSKCVCPAGTYSIRNDAGADECLACTDLELLRSRLAGDDAIAWEQPSVCPGSVSTETKICAQEGLWITVQEPGTVGKSGESLASTQVDLLTCPACQQDLICRASDPTGSNSSSILSIASCNVRADPFPGPFRCELTMLCSATATPPRFPLCGVRR